jgi:hypothetical protein
MTPEKLFHELLGLGMSWGVKGCEFDRESGVVKLEIAETKQLWDRERSLEEEAKVSC